jgi:16S rRNA (cytosine967-C5)-methyltransferase
MDVPESAVVNESVALSKAFRKTSAGGFINAVLRGFIRNGKTFEIPNLSVKYSAPEWLIEMLTAQYGSEITEEFLEDSVTFNGKSQVENEKSYSQDYSSRLACEALLERVGEGTSLTEDFTVLDMCAAPGGKSFAMSEMLNGKGKIISLELHQNRVDLMKKTVEKLGFENITVMQGDSSKVDGLPLADRILCDVPCSGLGVIRRKPEIKYNSPENFKDLPEIQYAILENSAKFLKSGGELVYSTCTLNKAENQVVVDKFLENHSEFQAKTFFENKGEPFGGSNATILPKYFNSNGFFISKIRRK